MRMRAVATRPVTLPSRIHGVDGRRPHHRAAREEEGDARDRHEPGGAEQGVAPQREASRADGGARWCPRNRGSAPRSRASKEVVVMVPVFRDDSENPLSLLPATRDSRTRRRVPASRSSAAPCGMHRTSRPRRWAARATSAPPETIAVAQASHSTRSVPTTLAWAYSDSMRPVAGFQMCSPCRAVPEVASARKAASTPPPRWSRPRLGPPCGSPRRPRVRDPHPPGNRPGPKPETSTSPDAPMSHPAAPSASRRHAARTTAHVLTIPVGSSTPSGRRASNAPSVRTRYRSHSASTSPTAGGQSSTVISPRASRHRGVSSRHSEKTSSAQMRSRWNAETAAAHASSVTPPRAALVAHDLDDEGHRHRVHRLAPDGGRPTGRSPTAARRPRLSPDRPAGRRPSRTRRWRAR